MTDCLSAPARQGAIRADPVRPTTRSSPSFQDIQSRAQATSAAQGIQSHPRQPEASTTRKRQRSTPFIRHSFAIHSLFITASSNPPCEERH